MTELTAAVRFVHLAAAVLLAGSFFFVAVIARPAVAGLAVEARLREALFLGWHRQAVRWSLLALIASGAVALALQAVVVSGSAGGSALDSTVVIALATETLYGNVWLGRMGISALLAVLLFLVSFGRIDQEAPSYLAVGLGLSACLLVSIAFSGHAAAAEGAQPALHVSSDAIHLLAAGAWLGGIPPLVALLRCCSRSASETAVAVMRRTTRRFSLLGIACVTALIVTGLYNAGILVGGWPQFFGTPYGQLLLAKLLLLLPLLGIAGINLLRISPAVAAAGAPGDTQRAARKLARNASLEAGLGLAVLLIVAMLGMAPPARHVEPDWPFAFRWDWSLLARSREATMALDWGLAWASFGAGVLVLAFFSRRLRPWAIAASMAVWTYAVSVITGPLSVDAYPTTYRRPSVTYQAISIANGKELYARHCSGCHGAEGSGDGPAGAMLQPLTTAHASVPTAGDLYWWVSRGVGPAMPGYRDTLAEEELWDVVNFMRALSAGERARSLGPMVGGDARLVAPDFSYATSDGRAGSLQEHRRDKVVLLVLPEARGAEARLVELEGAAAAWSKAGVEVLFVPRDAQWASTRSAGSVAIVTEGNAEIHETYAVFSRSLSDRSAAPRPPAVEFLIDRRGYLRARWLPGEGEAWRSPEVILEQAERVRREPYRVTDPGEHGH